jgi:hypothetical protein
MIRSRRSVLTVLTILFLFSLPLIISCPGPDKKPSYIGTWDINENLKGCGEDGMRDYTVEITSNEDKFNLIETKKYNFNFKCRLNADNDLLCGNDEIWKTNEDKYSFGTDSYILRFSGDDGLVGNSNWTYHPKVGDACNGHSELNGMRADDNN